MMTLRNFFETVAVGFQSRFDAKPPWDRHFDFLDSKNKKTRIILRELDDRTVSLSEQKIERVMSSAVMPFTYAGRGGLHFFSHDLASPEKVIFPSIKKEDALYIIEDYVLDIEKNSPAYEDWSASMRASKDKLPQSPAPHQKRFVFF